ncbi:hypothetical protein BGZ63DRAFT_26231 [Mariannaea sp. PMI_226]|nr:hypothetical protein BGZ63DRAFT_26231 [Mariannaea sp. PMI_226]
MGHHREYIVPGLYLRDSNRGTWHDGHWRSAISNRSFLVCGSNVGSIAASTSNGFNLHQALLGHNNHALHSTLPIKFDACRRSVKLANPTTELISIDVVLADAPCSPVHMRPPAESISLGTEEYRAILAPPPLLRCVYAALTLYLSVIAIRYAC